MNNGYPLSVIERTVSRYLSGRFEPTTKSSEPEKQVKYIKLPFYGHLSYVIRNKLQNLCKEFLPEVKVKFIFTNNYTIKSFFKFKDCVPAELVSKVVYEFECPRCNSRYVGETSRNLMHRYAEHRGVSVRTGKPLGLPSFSAIRTHAMQSDHDFSSQNFKLIDKGNSTQDIKILEALHIKFKAPQLNGKSGSSQLLIE